MPKQRTVRKKPNKSPDVLYVLTKNAPKQPKRKKGA